MSTKKSRSLSASARPLGAKLRLGISSCLLGNEVRFDGGHKRNLFLVDELAPFVEWVPVCPEVEAGMPTPRPALRLVRPDGTGAGVRVRETRSGSDHTRLLEDFAARRVGQLRGLDLSGYVLKKDSPSCGMERVKVYGPDGRGVREGRGVFAEALLAAFPSLPVEEEGRLSDPRLRENFIERLFGYERLRALFAGRWKVAEVMAFHTRHKLQLMAHSPARFRALGRFVAGIKEVPRAEFRSRYETEFMRVLEEKATRGRNADVLHHAAGHLKKKLDSASRQELAALIDDYRRGELPLIVPVTLIRHHTRANQIDYLEGQTYLEPHPKELMLRNHV